MSVRRLAPIAALAIMTAAAFAQGARRDGKWEVTTTMEMPGMPAGRGMPAMTTTQCITKEQAADPQKMYAQQAPQRGNQQNDCKVTDVKTSGSTTTWAMKCTTPQEMSGTGEVTYSENAYTSSMKMTMTRGGQTMEMTTKSTGKRVGDCTQ
jgi:hypothetical protein